MNHKTKPKPKGIILMEEPFHTGVLLEAIAPLKIIRRNEKVITTYDGYTLSSATCSDKYGVLDFSSLIRESIAGLSEAIKPETFSLRIERGIQELKLFGPDMEIDRSVFRKMLVCFSSSNGQHPLMIDAGLFRQVCANGLMAGDGANHFSIRTRHYSMAMTRHLQEFSNRLAHIPESIEQKIRFLRRLEGETISFRECANRLLVKEDATERKTMLRTIERFGRNLLDSPTDGLRNELPETAVPLLTDPVPLLRNATGLEDVVLPKTTAFHCYIELFRNRLHAVNERENRRIAEILIN